MEARPLKLRLLLEGLEVPVVSALVTGGVNAASAASIQVVPIGSVMEFLPRTLVHLFFYDPDEEAESERKKYKMLFVGEVMGIEYVRTTSQNVAVLKCLDFSSYWDVARLLFYQTFSEGETHPKPGTTAQTMVASGAGVYQYDRTKQSPASLLTKILTGKPLLHPDTEGFMGGLLLMLEMLGGVYAGGKIGGKKVEPCRGLNDFFSQAELRLHLSQTLGAARGDNSSAKLLNSTHFRRWVRDTISQQGNTISFRDIINLILRRLFSYYASVPAPNYTALAYKEMTHSIATSAPRSVPEQVRARLTALQELEAAVDSALTYEVRGIKEAVSYDKPAPAGTSLPPAQAGSDIMQSLPETHHKTGPAIRKFALGSSASGYTYTEEGTQGDQTVSYGTPATLIQDKDFGVAANADTKALQTAMQLSVPGPGPPEFPEMYSSVTLGKLQQLKEEVTAAKTGYLKKSRRYTVTKQKVMEAALPKLYTHLFVPDQFLCPAPRCNVLFPEHISSLAMSRDFSQEITRLHLTTRKEWEGQGLKPIHSKRVFIAPHIDVLFGKSAKAMMQEGEYFIFPHEVYSGIIPRFEQMPDMAAYEALSKEKVSVGGSEGSEIGKAVGQVDYLSRMADFLFVKYRIAGRTLAVSGRFNPCAVPGLAMLVLPTAPSADFTADLDKKLDSDLSRRRLLTSLAPDSLMAQLDAAIEAMASVDMPMQYAGVLHAVQHSVSQSGGTTSYTLSHVWVPGREEIPGISKVNLRYRSGWKTIKTTRRVDLTGVALKPGGLSGTKVGFAPGVDFNTILSNGPLDTAAFLANKTAGLPTAAQVQMDVDGKLTKWVGSHGGYITEAKFTELTDLSLLAAEEPGAPAHTRVTGGSGTLVLTEKVPIYKTKEITLPFEYLVRPVWLADVFSNPRVGPDFYSEVIGCLSICDGEQGKSEWVPGLGRKSSGLVITLIHGVVDRMLADLSLSFEVEGELLFGDYLPSTKLAVADIIGGFTIRDAACGAARMYARYYQMGKPGLLGQFISKYTRRGFADMDEILGTGDLFYSPEGVRMAGEEGFHSMAYGPFTDYVLLTHPKLRMYGGVGELRKLDPKLDPREERWQRVKQYFLDLAGMCRTGASASNLRG